MTTRRSAMQEDVRFRVLRLLRENPELSQRELSAALGVSLGATNYCLNALVDKGFVKLGSFSVSDDKRRYAYVLTPKGLSEKARLTGRFLKRKRVEYLALKAEIEALQKEVKPAVKSAAKPSSGC